MKYTAKLLYVVYGVFVYVNSYNLYLHGYDFEYVITFYPIDATHLDRKIGI